MVDLRLRSKFRVSLFCIGLIGVHYHSVAAEETSISLAQLTGCARSNNPALKVALADLESARALLFKASWSRAPTLSITSLLSPLPARKLLQYCVSDSDDQRVIPCPNQDIQDDARLSDVEGMGIYTRTSATLTQPLYTFGKISNNMEAARAGVEAREALLESAERSLDLLAFQAYYGLSLTIQAQKAFKKGMRHLKKHRAQVEQAIKEEKTGITSNDLRRLIIEQSQLTVMNEEVQAQHDRAVRGIQLSCALRSGQELTLAERRLKPLEVTLLSEAEYLQRAEANRPVIRAAQAELKARRSQYAAAVAEYFPDLALVGTFLFARGTSAEDNPDPFANDPFNVLGYGVYLGLNWRLDIAKTGAAIRSAQATIARSEASLAGLRAQLALEMNELYTDATRLTRVLDVQSDAAKQAKQWLTSAVINQGSGLSNPQETTTAIKAFFETSLRYDRTVYEYNVALARLWIASGIDPLELLKMDQP